MINQDLPREIGWTLMMLKASESCWVRYSDLLITGVLIMMIWFWGVFYAALDQQYSRNNIPIIYCRKRQRVHKREILWCSYLLTTVGIWLMTLSSAGRWCPLGGGDQDTITQHQQQIQKLINLKSNLLEINDGDHSNLSFRSCYYSWQMAGVPAQQWTWAPPCFVYLSDLVTNRAANVPSRRLREALQSQRRPLLGPSLGWKRLLALSHLRHY